MLTETEYTLDSRGSKFTLKKEAELWVMYVTNAATKAYRRGYCVPKYFDSLKDVEKKYKSWYGISQLVNDLTPNEKGYGS